MDYYSPASMRSLIKTVDESAESFEKLAKILSDISGSKAKKEEKKN